MKKLLTKMLFIFFLFSAAIPSTVQANFFNWTTLKSKKNLVAIGMGGTIFLLILAKKLYWDRARKKESGKKQRKTIELDTDTPLNLYEAIQEGNKEKAEKALKSGIDINKSIEKGWTPLTLAVANNHLDMVSLLLDNSANPDIRDRCVQTPLITAVYAGYSKLVSLLLGNGANPDVHNGPYHLSASFDLRHCTPLIVAACMDCSDIVKLLLKGGAEIDRTNIYGQTALMMAVSKPVRHGQTIMAENRGNLVVVKLLLEGGADLYKPSKSQGQTAWERTCGKPIREKIKNYVDKKQQEVYEILNKEEVYKLFMKKGQVFPKELADEIANFAWLLETEEKDPADLIAALDWGLETED